MAGIFMHYNPKRLNKVWMWKIHEKFSIKTTFDISKLWQKNEVDWFCCFVLCFFIVVAHTPKTISLRSVCKLWSYRLVYHISHWIHCWCNFFGESWSFFSAGMIFLLLSLLFFWFIHTFVLSFRHATMSTKVCSILRKLFFFQSSQSL